MLVIILSVTLPFSSAGNAMMTCITALPSPGRIVRTASKSAAMCTALSLRTP